MIKVFKIVLVSACLVLASNSFAKPRTCEVKYANGNQTTNWINLGQVGGTLVNKKKKCKELAKRQCRRALPLVKRTTPVKSPAFQSICAAGKKRVYFDTKVENKKNSRDGYCEVRVSCKRPPCRYTAYK